MGNPIPKHDHGAVRPFLDMPSQSSPAVDPSAAAHALLLLLDIDAKLHAQRVEDLVQGFDGRIAVPCLDVAQGMDGYAGDLAQRPLIDPQHVATRPDDFTDLLCIHFSEY